MSMRDPQLQRISAAGAAGLTVLLSVGVWLMSRPEKKKDDPLLGMEVIEASLASRTAPNNQPQKHREPPPKTEPAKGVSHDDKQKPEPKKKDPDPPKVDMSDLSKTFDHSGKGDQAPVTKPGDFNPNGYGNAEESKGDPWLGKLAADMSYAPPEIARGDSSPVGCIHLTPEGKILETKFTTTTTDDYQTLAEEALATLKKTRNANPVPVPTHLLKLTSEWLCFKFTIKAL